MGMKVTLRSQYPSAAEKCDHQQFTGVSGIRLFLHFLHTLSLSFSG